MNNSAPSSANVASAYSLFVEALSLDSNDAVEQFLQERCGDASTLREEVSTLLRAHAVAKDFLEQPIVNVSTAQQRAKKSTLESHADTPPAATSLSQHIGPYKLRQEVGKGGFGVVYMAEQVEPIQRRVAIKVLKPGMDSEAITRRFEAERHTLALMDHPNIARVLDAGTTDQGRPYFVMELVCGVPLTTFCDGLQMSIKERLRLFLDLCVAVEHAHQKGVIHRDLKPSNVLVSSPNGTPQIKVIDFGIAKAIDTGMDATMFTSMGHLLGTPQYMSPEQANLTQTDLDVRSDIFSLGVLLYELLTGSTPLEVERIKEMDYERFVRTLREEQVTRPSIRVIQHEQELAELRQSTPAELARRLRPELDWIVLRAVEKQRDRRYPSTSSLAHDVKQHLLNRPVSAVAPSWSYQASKFVARNRIGVAVGLAFLLLLVAGVVGTSIGLVSASRSNLQLKRSLQRETEATEEATSLAEQNQAVIDSFVAAFHSPDPIDGVGSAAMTALDVLRHARQQVASLGSAPPEQLTKASLLEAIGHSLRSLANFEEAISALQETLAIRRDILGDADPRTMSSLYALGITYSSAHRAKESVSVLEEATQLQTEVLGLQDPSTLSSMNALGKVYIADGRLVDGIDMLEKTLAQKRKTLGESHIDTAITMANLGDAYLRARRFEQAVALLETAVARHKSELGDDHPYTLVAQRALGYGYVELGRPQDAIPIMEHAARVNEEKFSREHPFTLNALDGLALAYLNDGQLERACQMFEEVVALQVKVNGDDSWPTLASKSNLARTYLRLQQVTEAINLLEAVVDGKSRLWGIGHPSTRTSALRLAESLLSEGEAARAFEVLKSMLPAPNNPEDPRQPLLLDSVALLQEAALQEEYWNEVTDRGAAFLGAHDDNDPLVVMIHVAMAEAYLEQREIKKSRQSLTSAQAMQGTPAYVMAMVKSLEGALHATEQNWEAAETLLCESYVELSQEHENIPTTHKAWLQRIQNRVLDMYRQRGMDAEAKDWLAKQTQGARPLSSKP